MVPKISPSRASARSCFEYDIRPKNGEPRGEWVAGTLAGTPRQMARMAGAYRSLRADCKKPVWRCSISLPPSDGRPGLRRWAAIANDFLAEMGIPADVAWCAIHHGDVDHDHIHITVIRTLPDGKLWSEERSAIRAIKACQRLEVVHQLATHDRTPKPKTTPSRAEIEISNRKGTPMTREIIQAAVDQAIGDYPDGIDFVDLQRLLAERQPPIDLQASMPKGVFRGVSYKHDGFSWPGSKIGKEYSTGLVERGVRMPTAESNTAEQSPSEQPTIPANTYPVAPSQQRQPLDRPTQQLQPVSEAVYAANQMLPQGPVVTRLGEVSERLDEMAPAMNTPFLNCAWALSKVVVFCAVAAANIAAALWRFLQRLLALFNLKTNQPLQFSEQPITPQLTYNPTHGERALELAEVDRNAAGAIDHVLECVKSGRPNDLPEDVDDEGRAELVAAMASGTKKGTPAEAEAAPLDALFDDHQTPPLPKSEPKIEPVDTFALLNTSMAEFVDTSIARTEAGKRDTPQVAAARRSLAIAEQKLQSAKLTYMVEKSKKGIFKRFVPAESVVIEAEQIAFNQAQKGLAAAETQHPSTTPPALQERHADALAKVKAAATQHHAKMLRDVDQYVNAKVKKIALYQAQRFQAQFDIFGRAPISGHLHAAVQVAEEAPKSISTALAIAAQEEEMAARRNVYVPSQTRNDEDTDGQK